MKHQSHQIKILMILSENKEIEILKQLDKNCSKLKKESKTRKIDNNHKIVDVRKLI